MNSIRKPSNRMHFPKCITIENICWKSEKKKNETAFNLTKKKKKYNAHDVYLDDYSNKKVMIFNK